MSVGVLREGWGTVVSGVSGMDDVGDGGIEWKKALLSGLSHGDMGPDSRRAAHI